LNLINFSKKLGRKEIGVDGKNQVKTVFNMTEQEFSWMPPIERINFQDFLPNSLLRKQQQQN